MGTAAQHVQLVLHIQRQADLIGKIVSDETVRRLPHKAARDGLHGMDPREVTHQIRVGEDLPAPVDHDMVYVVFLQKGGSETGGKIGPPDPVEGEFRFEEARACVQGFAGAAALDQIPVPGGVIIMAVAQCHRVHVPHVQPQPMGVCPGMGPGTAIEQHPEGGALHQERQPVLCDERFVFRRVIVHQRRDAYHAWALPFRDAPCVRCFLYW